MFPRVRAVSALFKVGGNLNIRGNSLISGRINSFVPHRRRWEPAGRFEEELKGKYIFKGMIMKDFLKCWRTLKTQEGWRRESWSNWFTTQP